VYDVVGREFGRYLRYMVLWPPAITLPATCGALTVVYRSIRGRAGDGERFLVLVVVSLVSVRALLAEKWQLRYLADLWPLWELVAAWTLVQGWSRLCAWIAPGRRLRAALAAAAVLAALLLPGTGIVGTSRFLRLDHGQATPTRLGLPPFYPDLEEATAWLAPRIGERDRVIATDWLSTYCYLGRVDYWVRSRGYGVQAVLSGGRPRDVYVGAEVVRDLAELQAVIADSPAWLVAGGLETAGFDEKLQPEIREWLSGLRPEFEASDGRTRVYRFGPIATTER
jgi:hypothetical protein